MSALRWTGGAFVSAPWVVGVVGLALSVGCGTSSKPGGKPTPTATPTSTSTAVPIDAPNGPPGCGLGDAAFCDPFDAPSTTKGRAGELDSGKWSAARFDPLQDIATEAIPIGPALLPSCRPGLPATVMPDQDTLICDASTDVGSNHLIMAVAAQNYGLNSYRIRQPFDFSGRTGKIVFDAEGYTMGGLWGWVSLEVTEDPTPAPHFAAFERGILPKNAFEIHFYNTCGQSVPPSTSFGVYGVHIFKNYVDTAKEFDGSVPQPTCVAMQQGKLNHFEIDVSQDQLDVYASPFSSDGVTFPEPQLLYTAKVSLPFTRGYVHVTTHNHATLKYTGPTSEFSQYPSLQSWSARWDNVGFDGPVLSNWREYEVPDSLVKSQDPKIPGQPALEVGYFVNDVSKGPGPAFTFKGVDVANVSTARLALAAFYLGANATPQWAESLNYTLQFRFNGGAWHDRPLTADEIKALNSSPPYQLGYVGQMIDVPVSDLVAGDNTLEIVSKNVPTSYPPELVAIDLVLGTK